MNSHPDSWSVGLYVSQCGAKRHFWGIAPSPCPVRRRHCAHNKKLKITKIRTSKKLSYRRDSARCGIVDDVDFMCGRCGQCTLYLDMLGYNGVGIVGQANHKVKPVLKWTVWSQCTPLPNRRYWRTVKRPFKVTQGHPLLCQSTPHLWLPIGTYNSNLTSFFNRCWDISYLVSTSVYLPLFQVKLKIDGWK